MAQVEGMLILNTLYLALLTIDFVFYASLKRY